MQLLCDAQTLNDGSVVTISEITRDDERVRIIHSMLNAEIEKGDSYPQENSLLYEEFSMYFLSGSVFIAEIEEGKEKVLVDVSHVCNGGFITNAKYRGRGVAKAMGRAYINLGPKLGFKSSVFNLVFETNKASIAVWRSLGFSEIGRVPNAVRLNSAEYVDAIVFYYQFN